MDDKSAPDCLISVMTDNYITCNIGFGEVKSESEARNHRLVNFDLIRLGIFAKNAIDNDPTVVGVFGEIIIIITRV